MRGVHHQRRGLALLLAGALLTALSLPQGTTAEEETQVRLVVKVTAEESGEPIEGASVYIKFKEKRLLWKDKKLEWNSKTHKDGEAVFPPLPEGRVLVQVIAEGWKTYGRYHLLEGPKHVLEIKLKPPKKWY